MAQQVLPFVTVVTKSKHIIRFRQEYLQKIHPLSNRKKFVTDKMPHNFMYIPFILAALPEAKIIHVKRDAAATCWSNFKHYFMPSGLGILMI